MKRKERLQRRNGGEVAAIRLMGEPYHREVDGAVIDCTDTLETLAANMDYEARVHDAVECCQAFLQPLYEGGYYGLDAKIKKGHSLSFEEAFSLMTFVSMGVNRTVYRHLYDRLPAGMPNDPDTIFLQSIALLSAMSSKEGFVGLTPAEIAGLTAATLEIDTIVRVPAQDVIGMGGMGGDRGYRRNGDNSKLFSLSTLSAAVLANMSTVHKHHSYPNTSKVAGQSAVEALGARSDQDSLEAFIALQSSVNLLMSSCHTTRLIHTLSHRLKGETINHIVGPLALPIDRNSRVSAFIGVNDNVHPETVIAALSILHNVGIQTYTNSVAFCGLSGSGTESHLSPEKYYADASAKMSVAIDEVAPPPHSTLAAFMVNGENAGSYLIEPLDFMGKDLLSQLNIKSLLIPNAREAILSANNEAITGADVPKALYLAMTSALAIFTQRFAHLPGALDHAHGRVNRRLLRQAYQVALEIIRSGAAANKLAQYVQASIASTNHKT